MPRCNVTVANETVKVDCTVQSNNDGAADMAQVTAAAEAAAKEAVALIGALAGVKMHTYKTQ